MKNELNRTQRLKQLRSKKNEDLTSYRLILAKEYVKDFPKHGPGWVDYAIVLIELARYNDAKNALSNAINLCPKNKLYIPFSQMGHLHDFKGEYQEAAKWFAKCIENNPNDASFYVYQGSVLSRAGNIKEAELCYRKALQCPEGCIDEVYLNLGYVLRSQEKFDESLYCFNEAIKIDPKYKEAKLAIKDVLKTIDYVKKCQLSDKTT